jgi:hypothetical protein
VLRWCNVAGEITKFGTIYIVEILNPAASLLLNHREVLPNSSVSAVQDAVEALGLAMAGSLVSLALAVMLLLIFH